MVKVSSILKRRSWKNPSRIYGMIAHLEIAQDGKIWLHHDGTGLELAYILVEKGVAKKDIG